MDYAKELQRALRRRGYHDATVTAIAAGDEPTAVYAVGLPAEPGGPPLRLQGTVGELGYRLARLPRRTAPAPRDKRR
jgi:hypothetical protein